MSSHGLINIIQTPRGRAAVAAKSIDAGFEIFDLTGILVDRPDTFTIQLNEKTHLAPQDALWALVNHSCDPNCHVDVDTLRMTALRPIRNGEELSFDYLTTEWAMASPFSCDCRSPLCRGWIRGFKFLPEHDRRMLAPRASGFLRQIDALLRTESLVRGSSLKSKSK